MNTNLQSEIETLITFGQAAERLHISLRQFRRLVDSGKLPFVRIGERSPRIRPSDLNRYLNASVIHYPSTS